MTAGENYSPWGDRNSTAVRSGPSARPVSARRNPQESFWRRAVRKRKDLPVWQETLIFLIVLFFFAVIVRTFVAQAYEIPSSSMQGTIQVGDRVLVNKVSYDFREPQRGEVVVFRGTAAWQPENATDDDASMFSRLGSGLGNLVGITRPGQNDFIKRVIGLPGDTVACCDSSGRVTVNGVGIDEPYVTQNAPVVNSTPNSPSCADRNFRPIVVDPGMMFVMGDRRLVSQDSRCQGQVPIANVIGRATAIIWPTSDWSGFPIPSTFRNVPAPEALGVAQPVPVRDSSSLLALIFPLLSVLGVSARSRRHRRVRRRTLRA